MNDDAFLAMSETYMSMRPFVRKFLTWLLNGVGMMLFGVLFGVGFGMGVILCRNLFGA